MRLFGKKRSTTFNVIASLGATGISAAAVLAAGKIIRKASRSSLDLHGKLALITGGSRGLGLALARELGTQGCRLALCARDAAELEEACRRLMQDGIEAKPFVCDISHESEIQPLISRVLAESGEIDILVNNAGHITVGPLDTFEHADFERAMNVMFWAPLNLTFAVLPYMKARRSGHIVNITSVGGRVSVPHLLPYSCAKFAFVGFSTGLSAELSPHGLHVLTVVPGLMRTGSYLNAEFKGSAKHEFAWFGLSSSLPGLTVSAHSAARCIRNALEERRHTCTISLPAKVLIASEALMPESTRAILAFVNRAVLPRSDDRHGPVTGKVVNPEFSTIFQGLTSLGKLAARELNE